MLITLPWKVLIALISQGVNTDSGSDRQAHHYIDAHVARWDIEWSHPLATQVCQGVVQLTIILHHEKARVHLYTMCNVKG